MRPYDVVYVSRDGTIDSARYDREASAALLKNDHAAGTEVYAIQMIAGRYEVYDLREITFGSSMWLKGPPKLVSDDYDAAITWALLMCGREP